MHFVLLLVQLDHLVEDVELLGIVSICIRDSLTVAHLLLVNELPYSLLLLL